MRRLVLILALVVSGLALPARPADALSLGACVVNGGIAYQSGLAPMVPPQIGGSVVGMHLTIDCLGVGGGLYQGAGIGSTSGSCLQEIGNATLTNGPLAAQATWVRAGFAGWLIVTWTTGPSTAYAYEGPFVWLPSSGDPFCLLGPVFSANIVVGAGPHMGV